MPTAITLDNLNFADYVKPGDTVTWGQGCAEPLTLTKTLVRQRSMIGHFSIFVGLSFSDTLNNTHLDDFNVISYGAMGTNSTLGSKLQILPGNYSSIPRIIADRTLPIDVVLVQLSPRGPDGHYSLGFANDYLIPAMQSARLVIAEVNDQVPCTTLAQPLDESLLDVVIHCSNAAIHGPSSAIGKTEKQIASHLQDIIQDGAVIQYGIGSVPSAILSSLSQHRRLGIYSGMLTEDVIPLIESGVITNETNTIRPGITVGALAIGGEDMRHFLHLNKEIELHPAAATHGARYLAQQDRLVAINSAIEVDLYGQVNAEVIKNRYIGAVGGQVDFMHAASTQQDGLSIIAMPSTTRDGNRSRIVARLNTSLITTGKSDVDIVATEMGIADLRGKTITQRMQALRNVAAPQFRDEIDKLMPRTMP